MKRATIPLATPSRAARSAPRARRPSLARFIAAHWEGAPAVLAGGAAPLAADELYALAVRAAAPFAAGTRFRAVPDVRFFAGPDRIRAPGARLPSSEDRTFAAYLARCAEPAGVQLQILHPLILDFALWSQARRWLDALWAEVGVPVLPVASELLLGSWREGAGSSAPRPHHTAVTWVLAGALTAQLEASASPASSSASLAKASSSASRTKRPVLRGGAGDLLVWSPRFAHRDAGEACLALRFWVPAAGAGLADAVKDVAVSLMERRLGPHHPVPYLPLPPASARRFAAAPLEDAAALLGELCEDDLPRALQIQWAKRVSAAALEPVPAALAAGALDDDGGHLDDEAGELRLVTPPLRMALEDGLAVWAVHGHAFSLRHEARAAAVLARWRRGPLRLAALPAADRPAARELAAQLLRLRAARLERSR